MKTAGLRELKDNLSKYVRAVARGERLLVTFRGRPLAELGPAKPDIADPLVKAGFRPAKRPVDRRWRDRSAYRLGPTERLSAARVQALLDEDRAG